MTSITLEINKICRGCLSSDRNLYLLRNNVHLYFLLIADQFIPAETRNVDLYLCWECIAILNNVSKFQATLQKSKDSIIKRLAHKPPSVTNCLSRLSVVQKDGYDLIIAHTDSDSDVEIIEPKTDIIIISDDNEVATTSAPKRNKHESVLPTRQVIYDESDKHRYIKEIDMTVEELGALKRNRKNNIRGFSNRANSYVNKMMSDKERDVSTFVKRVSRCSKCSIRILRKKTMRLHWNEHLIILYKCDFCDHWGLDRDEVMTHIIESHCNVYGCECGLEYRSVKEYCAHRKKYHTVFECDYCERRCNSRTVLEKHIIHRHLPYVCAICHRNFKTYSSLTSHSFSSHPEEKPGRYDASYCVECDIRFINVSLYKRHLRTSRVHRSTLTAVRIPCPNCGKIFTRRTYMLNHYKSVHERELRHHCELCNKYFASGYGVRTHWKTVHAKLEKPKNKKCRVCGEKYYTNRALFSHIQTHTKSRYQCRYCLASFKRGSAMQSHEKRLHKNDIYKSN